MVICLLNVCMCVCVCVVQCRNSEVVFFRRRCLEIRKTVLGMPFAEAFAAFDGIAVAMGFVQVAVP